MTHRSATLAIGAIGLTVACNPNRSVPPPPLIPVVVRCTVMCAVNWTGTPTWNGRVFVAERVDPNMGGNFQGFRPLNGPLGDTSLLNFVPTSGPDTYAINEAWLQWPGEPEVHRAQVTPGPRTDGAVHDFNGSSWNIVVQNAAGIWGAFPIGRGSWANGKQPHAPEDAAPAVPQFMPVGLVTLQMFACAGTRTEDNAEPTTALFESIGFNGVTGAGGTVRVIQDLLSGDSRFTPSSSFSAIPASQPPLPTITGPGDPIRKGMVRCAMTQRDDDVTTRELHMLAIDNGKLYHSKLSNFGPVTSPTGVPLSRFRTVTPWGDVGQVLGGGFGTILQATVVAHPASISVFFTAESTPGRYRIWHTVRFGSGSWRPAVDVLAATGDAAAGTVYPFKVAAGICPVFGATAWNAQTSEMLLALWGGPSPLQVLVIRVALPTSPAASGANPTYSAWQSIPAGQLTGPFLMREVTIAARPFRDDGQP